MRKLRDGIATNLFVGGNVMLSFVEIAPHVSSPVHSHPEEQWGYLLEGECVRIQDGEEVPMKAGAFWCARAHVPHGIRTGDRSALILDIFSPPRKAFLTPGEGFGAHEGAPERLPALGDSTDTKPRKPSPAKEVREGRDAA